MSSWDALRFEVIAVIGVLLLIGTIIPGVRLYWPRHRDPVSRSDLGVALMGGALIAFAVLVMQLMVQFRSESDARQREEQAERQSLLLLLGRSQNLEGLDLESEDLRDAFLSSKVLRGAILKDATMTGAELQNTDLVGASLVGADLRNAKLDRADLRYADLAGARLEGASLRGARLDAANLTPRETTESGRVVRVPVNLSGADLSNALVRADLRGAILKDAKLIGAKLAPADLRGADLSGTDLFLADLRGANLKGADLDGAVNLTRVKDFSFAIHDRETDWPQTYTWEGTDPENCHGWRCSLVEKEGAVNDFPPELTSMRRRLVDATRARRCLPGWWVEETPLAIVAHAPRYGATFRIQTWLDVGTDAETWARDFEPDGVSEVPPIRARGAVDTYGHLVLDGENRQPKAVAVYFIREDGRGFRFFGEVPARWFDLFQRDFLKIFRELGVRGDVFPSLRGETDGCGLQAGEPARA